MKRLTAYETHKMIREVFPDAITTWSLHNEQEQTELFDIDLYLKMVPKETYEDMIHNLISGC